MAAVLTDHLSTVMGWIPAPSDVMSGYGVNGDVANGSFEDAAPFGGYGWRYMLAQGVSRVHHPVGAFDGEFYMRLESASEIHQPNPASGGDSVTVTVWMRGAEVGDQAEITIDFRDQQIWTTPLQVETQTVTLSQEWRQYSVTSVAPIGGPKPVHHTRVTFAAAPGGATFVDAVVMTVE